MNNRFKLLMQAQQSGYQVDCKDQQKAVIRLSGRKSLSFTKDSLSIEEESYEKVYGRWGSVFKELFTITLDEFYENCFENPFKPTKLEADTFKLLYNMVWPIEEGDHV